MSFTYRRSYRGPVRAVIFDWAGTTVDYGSTAPAVTFVQLFEQRGVPVTVEEARGPMGAHKKVHIRKMAEMPAVAQRWKDAHGEPCGEDDVESMFQEFVPLLLKCLGDHADLIPGTLDAVTALRERGCRIGSTTGYSAEMMELVRPEAKRRGYEPDAVACVSDVPAGRPAPWMCLRNAEALGVFPLEACVKVGDTVPDVEEGLNAGMWTIAVARTGNEMGLSEAEVAALEPDERTARLARARRRLAQGGAHYVVDTIAQVPAVVGEIEARLRAGERP